MNAARDPATAVQGVLDLASSVSRQLVITGGSLSPLLVDHSTTTRFELISVPGARAAALALGGSRNDLLVAGAASGLGLYHERLGSPCEELRLSSPTTQRHSVGGGRQLVRSVPRHGADRVPSFRDRTSTPLPSD